MRLLPFTAVPAAFFVIVLAPLPAAAGEDSPANIFMFENFEQGPLENRYWPQAKRVEMPAYNNSSAAAAAVAMPGNRYFGMGFSCDLKQRPKTMGEMALFFVYKCDSIQGFKIQINGDSNNGNIVYHFRTVPDIWVPMYLPFSAMRFDNGVPADLQGVTLSTVNLYGGRPGAAFDFFVDDFCVFYGLPPEPITDEILRQKEAAGEINASLSKERYTLNQGLVYRIRAARANAPEPPRPKTIMRAGSTAAADSGFIRRLAMRELRDYDFVSTSHGARKGKPLSWIKEHLEQYLPKDRPETVFFMPGIEDAVTGAGESDIRKAVEEIIDLCHQHGAAVILCTPPERLDVQTPLAAAARQMSAILSNAAENKLVPFLDASALANGDPQRNFRGVVINSRGYKEINEAAIDLLKKLERWAFGRGAPVPEDKTPRPSQQEEEKDTPVEGIEDIEI